MAASQTASGVTKRVSRRNLVVAGAVAAVATAIALDTEVVRIGSEEDLRQQAFDPDRFGADEFPRIRDFVLQRAADAAALAAELEADRNAAVAAHGTVAGAFPVMAVSLTGVAGEGRSGVFHVAVDGLPDDMVVRVQTGPAINGTELRDVVGDIAFGAFTNQIEYQDAGAGINRAMSSEILAELDRDALAGRTISVTGAFTMINPKNWLVTPVRLEVR